MFPKIVFILMTILVAGVSAFPAYADPILLEEVGRFANSQPGIVHQITFRDDYMYVSLDDGGLEIRDRYTTAQLGHIRAAPTAYAIQYQLRGNYAYVADWDRLSIIDISVPTNPTVVGSWGDFPHNVPTVELAPGVVLHGDYAYLSVRNHGIVTIDISDPFNPFDVGLFPEPASDPSYARMYMPNEPNRIVAAAYRGVHTFDITDPENLGLTKELGAYPCSGFYFDDATNLGYVRFSYTTQTMYKVYDYTDADNPVHLFTYKESLPDGETHAIRAMRRLENYMFVADCNREVSVYDVTELTNPQKVAYFPLPADVTGFACDINFDGDIAYIGTHYSGVIMLDISPLTVIPEPAAILMPLFMFLSGASLLVKRLRR